jgi:hypothetical protein
MTDPQLDHNCAPHLRARARVKSGTSVSPFSSPKSVPLDVYTPTEPRGWREPHARMARTPGEGRERSNSDTYRKRWVYASRYTPRGGKPRTAYASNLASYAGRPRE